MSKKRTHDKALGVDEKEEDQNQSQNKHKRCKVEDGSDLVLPNGIVFTPEAVESKVADQLWEDCNKKLSFHALMYRGKPMPRPKAPFYVETYTNDQKDVCIPLYRFPGLTFKDKPHPPWESKDKLPASILAVWEQHAPQANHLIITRFEDGKHFIGGHRDKVVDLAPGYPIVDIVLGPQGRRPFEIIEGPTVVKGDSKESKEVKMGQKWVLRPGHGAKIVISYEANKMYTHAVPALKTKKQGIVGPRISLVFRTIKTAYCPQTRKIQSTSFPIRPNATEVPKQEDSGKHKQQQQQPQQQDKQEHPMEIESDEEEEEDDGEEWNQCYLCRYEGPDVTHPLRTIPDVRICDKCDVHAPANL